MVCPPSLHFKTGLAEGAGQNVPFLIAGLQVGLEGRRTAGGEGFLEIWTRWAKESTVKSGRGPSGQISRNFCLQAVMAWFKRVSTFTFGLLGH
jgi:hypothetical protein